MNPVVDLPTFDDTATIASLFSEDMSNLRIAVPEQALLSLARDVVEQASSADGRCVMWVARMSPATKPVGLILGIKSWSLKFGGASVWIEELYVTPDARRHGIGRVLVEKLLDWADDNQVHGVDLEAYQGNTPASVLYRSLGFHRLGRERFYYKLANPHR